MPITLQDILANYSALEVIEFQDEENELASNEGLLVYWPGGAPSNLIVRSDVDPVDYAFLFLAALTRWGELRSGLRGWESCIPHEVRLSVDVA